MKIFLSWSGETSHEIARALKDWLPLVHQRIDAFMSSEDIEKGSRWHSTIGSELEGTNFGVLCLTAENVDAPWVCFEAGALAKIVEQAKVAPILFGIQPSDVQGPLAQFQATKFEKEDITRLVRTINASSPEEARDDSQIERLMHVWWPELQKTIEPIIAIAGKAKPKRDKAISGSVDKFGPILEELLVLVRQQTQIVSDPSVVLPQRYLRDAVEGLLARRDRDWLTSPYDLMRAWTRFDREWIAFLPELVAIHPTGQVDAVRRAYIRVDDLMTQIMSRYENPKLKWRRGAPSRGIALSTGAVSKNHPACDGATVVSPNPNPEPDKTNL